MFRRAWACGVRNPVTRRRRARTRGAGRRAGRDGAPRPSRRRRRAARASGGPQPERAVRPGRVVVAGVLAQHLRAGAARPTISSQSRHSRRTVPTQRSAKAFAAGRPHRRADHPDALRRRTRRRTRAGTWRRDRGAARWGGRPPRPAPRSGCAPAGSTQAAVGCAVQPATNTRRVCTSRKNSTYSDLQADRLDGEEVARQQPGGVGPQERRPGEPRPPGRRRAPGAGAGAPGWSLADTACPSLRSSPRMRT